MDKKQIIGLALIFAMLLGFQYFKKAPEPTVITENTEEQIISPDTDTDVVVNTPSVEDSLTVAQAPERIIEINNEDISFKISSKGAKFYDFKLSKYKVHDKTEQVVLLQNDKTSLNTFLNGENISDPSFNYSINVSSDKISAETEQQSIVLTGKTKAGKTIKHTFTVPSKGYLIKHSISGEGLNNQNDINFELKNTLPVLERKFENYKGYAFARQHATAGYYSNEDGYDDIGAGADESEQIEGTAQWYSFSQRFFTIGINPTSQISNLKLTADYKDSDEDLDYIKKMSASYTVPLFLENGTKKYSSNIYVGPNDYYTLEATGIVDLGENVDMGPLIFGLINKFAILPVFDFLADSIHNFGLVILLLVLLIKIVLFPIAYKSYSSMAKMKALKPDLDALKEKHGDDQKAYGAAQMGLYRQAGVNPLAGCLPQLLQIPILFALFRFFPNAIQLRQESFLWAKDLSTFDALISWDTWIFGLGTHISIFTILMTLTTLLNSWYNSQFSANTSNNPAAEQMKYMMYFMPLIFFFVLNDYPSGLTFYYFISTLFTIGQQFVANKMIDTDKIRSKIDTNVKNSANGTAKKSRFQQRMEAAMEAQNAAKKGKK